MTQTDANLFADAPVIHEYTAAQAVADGVLFDGLALEDAAGAERLREAFGGRPVFLTLALHELIAKAVAHPRWCNDWAGVLHDIVWMSHVSGARRRAAVQAKAQGSGRATFLVIITGTGRWRNHYLDVVIDGNGLTYCLRGED